MFVQLQRHVFSCQIVVGTTNAGLPTPRINERKQKIPVVAIIIRRVNNVLLQKRKRA